jgi:hypothetical protein
MLFPKYVLEDLSVGSCSIIGKGKRSSLIILVCIKMLRINLWLSMHKHFVHMLEARFVNLNPFMQQMFLKLHDIEDSEKKDFIL